jgi:EGF-domain serine glucosyl/xylosyltransferase
MFNKKIRLFFVSLLIFSLISYLVFVKSNKTRIVETFLKSFPKQQFKSKLLKEHPKWMDEQIMSDLKGFNKNNITLSSVDQTYNKILSTIPQQKNSFIRYRIINNKLYRYYPNNCLLSKKEPSFEKAIKTLTQLVQVPDMDLIYSDMDGTPEFYVQKDFYIVSDLKNQAPLFTRAKIVDVPYVVLIPDYYSVSTQWKKDCIQILDQMKKYPWDKKSPLAFWRGGAHDKGYDVLNYKSRPRVIISMLSKDCPDLVEAGIIVTDSMQLKDTLILEKLVKNSANIEEHLKYKYLPALDGYMCTYPGYQWRLLCNSVCFKQSSKEVQWFYSALKPYEHYIPIENDMSDLLDKVKWAKDSDEICEKIAKNATNFVLNNLMLEDVYLYLYKVLDSYSSYLNIDKNELIKSTKSDSNWICIQQRRKANKIILTRKANEEKKCKV